MTKKFELCVLISLINGQTIATTTDAQVDELIEHITGAEAMKSYGDAWDTAVEHVTNTCEGAVRAAKMLGHYRLGEGKSDIARYNKLIDLHKKFYEIASLVPVKEKSPEEQEEQALETA